MSNPKDEQFLSLFSDFMPYDKLKKLVRTKYSTLNEAEKLHVCCGACSEMAEDMVYDQCPENMNDIWNEPVLMMLKDLGYDIEPLRIKDWKHFKRIGRRYGPILIDIENRLRKFDKLLYRKLTMLHIIFYE